MPAATARFLNSLRKTVRNTYKAKSTGRNKDEITQILQTRSGDSSRNRFLAFCPTLSNGCFSYRLSQPSKRVDSGCSGRGVVWRLVFLALLGNDPPWRSSAV